MKISATIVTLNEERNIARAIESLRCADEVIVVDSGSTDRTCELAARLGARVIEEPWRGYAAQKNFASGVAAQDWILSLDADETVSEELEAEILALKLEGPRFDGYSMPRMAQDLLAAGFVTAVGIRTARSGSLNRNRAEWTGDYVHEAVAFKPGLAGRAAALDGRILHFTCDSLSAHLRTLDRYTTLAAMQVQAQDKNVPVRRLMVDPAWTFFRTYLIQGGFLDGPQGLAIAWMAALYTFLKYAKARQDLAG